MRTYRFTVPFVMGKQRPRFGRGRTYTPRETAQREADIADAYVRLTDTKAPSGVPVRIDITERRALPKKAPKRLRAECDLGKPDLDNVMKLVLDALNGVAYEDDSQVVEVHGVKEWRTHRGSDETEIAVTFPEFWSEKWNRLEE